MDRFVRRTFAAMAGALAVCGSAGLAAEAVAPRAPAAPFTTYGVQGWRQIRLLTPGEWIPYGCGLAMPYRGGTTLRFERQDPCYRVSIDEGPPQLAWVRMGTAGGLDVLQRELEQGGRGFAVLCLPSDLAKLPPLPRGREIALTVSGELADFAALRAQPGVAALCLYPSKIADLGPLAEFPDLMSLRLAHWSELADLRPLARLPKVTWVQLDGASKLQDLAPLAEMPSLQGLKLVSCGRVADLRPLARSRSLRALTLEWCEGVRDFAPLAELTRLRLLHVVGMDLADLRPLAAMAELVELDLRRCKGVSDLRPIERLSRLQRLDLDGTGVTDLTPLRYFLRRGGELAGCPAALRPQIERLRSMETDF